MTMQLCSCFCVFACFALVRIEAQDPTATAMTNKYGFIDPISGSNFEDSFLFGDLEYLFVNNYLTKTQAERLCAINYDGKLGFIKSKAEAQYLSDALTETYFELEYMWVGGKISTNNETLVDTWTTEDNQPFPEEVKEYQQNKTTIAGAILLPRACVAFGRFYHEKPAFIPLPCSVYRPVICERSFTQDNKTDNGTISDNDWIITKFQEYKIFYHRVAFENASINCFSYDQKAELATVPPEDVATLGRYLLIGRPSLENAWIGAKYQETATGEPDLTLPYKWRDGSNLSREINETMKYAPWKGGKAIKAGCALLDRHLADTVLFIEAPCYRHRPYICSRPLQGNAGRIVSPNIDFSLVKHDYRLYYTGKSWGDAKKTCKDLGKAYNIIALLSEIHDNLTMQEILFIIGENRTAIQHMWLGGLYDTTISSKSEWVWLSNLNVEIDSSEFTIITNKTDGLFTAGIEGNNRCLNIDRENHVQALVYGADCSYEQIFMCQANRGALAGIPAEIGDTFPPRPPSNKRSEVKSKLESAVVSQQNQAKVEESDAKVFNETTTSTETTTTSETTTPVTTTMPETISTTEQTTTTTEPPRETPAEAPVAASGQRRRKRSDQQSGERTFKKEATKPKSKKKFEDEEI